MLLERHVSLGAHLPVLHEEFGPGLPNKGIMEYT